MSYEKLVCPQCKFLIQAAPQGGKLACPRCALWLDVYADCSGGCLSCKQNVKAEETGSCADLSIISSSQTERKDESSMNKTTTNSVLDKLLALVSKAIKW